MSSPTLFYSLRSPFSNLWTVALPGWADLYVEIDGTFSGILRVNEEDAKKVITDAFAGDHIATFLSPTTLSWRIKPSLYEKEVLIDDEGNLHLREKWNEDYNG